MQQIRFILFVALATLVALFAILNAESMRVNLLLVRYEVSASIVILASVMLGSILTILFGLSTQVRTLFRDREKRKLMDSIQKQLDLTKKTLEEVKLSEAEWKAKYEESLIKPDLPLDVLIKNQE